MAMRSRSRRYSTAPAALLRRVLLLSVALLALSAPGALAAGSDGGGRDSDTYRNPLNARIPGDGFVESCADPSIIRGRGTDNAWYAYCTTDPLNDEDFTTGTDGTPQANFHLIPILRSTDLAHWRYVGDAFTTRPDWVGDTAGLWAPEIKFFNGQYYLYFTAPETDLPGGGSAIGVATAPTPTGPWTASGVPVVEPHGTAEDPNARRWVFDPFVIESEGQRYIFYGSYFGGVSARRLSPDGLVSDPATQTQIVIGNRYEGTFIWRHGDYWYFFGSATNCCNGPLTGYSVFTARSKNLLGPYVDREGASLLEGRVGGTTVLSMNGNRWVGPGHNAVFTDFAGQDWFLYHAVDRFDPYFTFDPGFTKRPLMMDPLDWVNGWPTVRGGRWASQTPQPAPAAQPGDTTHYQTQLTRVDVPGRALPRVSEEFNSSTLDTSWTWVRPPDPATYGLESGTFRWDTQAGDLFVDSNDASVLTHALPARRNWIVEARVRLNVPPEGCCHNYVQAGLVVYGDDDNFIKLAHVSIWETRQNEFAKELAPVPPEFPRYGNSVVGPPSEWTYMRIVKTMRNGEERYRAYTSRDGTTWTRGGVWTHHLGAGARIGLISMGGTGFTANFDYVRFFNRRTAPLGGAIGN